MQASELKAGVWRIDLSGFLDAGAVSRMESQFMQLMPVGGHGVIVDLAGVEYCGSLGIRMLLSAAKLVEQRGGRMVLSSPQAQMRQLIEHVRLGHMIPVAPTLEDAQSLLG
jgi:stage II sporulation protein AA (anti-sigma F factor antagonist)